jgi:hypothetical protein
MWALTLAPFRRHKELGDRQVVVESQDSAQTSYVPHSYW